MYTFSVYTNNVYTLHIDIKKKTRNFFKNMPITIEERRRSSSSGENIVKSGGTISAVTEKIVGKPFSKASAVEKAKPSSPEVCTTHAGASGLTREMMKSVDSSSLHLRHNRLTRFSHPATRFFSVLVAAREYLHNQWSLVDVPASLKKEVVLRALTSGGNKYAKIGIYHIIAMPTDILMDPAVRSILLTKHKAELSTVLAERITSLKTYYLSTLGITNLNLDKMGERNQIRLIVDRALARYADHYDPRPLALSFYAKNDWNGAFSYFSGLTWSSMWNTHRILLYEPNDKLELKQNFISATERVKASLLLFVGHGTAKSISYGGPPESYTSFPDDRYRLTTRDRTLFSPLKDRVLAGAHIVLNSCSTGAGGRNADNMLNAVARWFPKTCVSALMQDSSLRFITSRSDLLVGVEASEGRVAVKCPSQEKDSYREYEELNSNIEPLGLPSNTTTNPSSKKKYLEQALNDASEITRLAALYELSKKETETDGDVVPRYYRLSRFRMTEAQTVSALSSDDPYILRRTLFTLDREENISDELKGHIMPAIIPLSKHRAPEVRSLAVSLMAKLIDQKKMKRECRKGDTMQSILSATKDESWLVRKTAVRELAQFNHPFITSALFSAALHDRNVEVQEAAFLSLKGKIDYRHVPALFNLMMHLSKIKIDPKNPPTLDKLFELVQKEGRNFHLNDAVITVLKDFIDRNKHIFKPCTHHKPIERKKLR